MSTADCSMENRIATALRAAGDTRVLRLSDGAIAESADVFRFCFGVQPGVIVADVNTFDAAGKRLFDLLQNTGTQVVEPVVFDDPNLHAYYRHVENLVRTFKNRASVPIAVGSGTINDLVKLAAHQCGLPYMAVATAASMDGYTAYGASINHQGSKQTFFCPAPQAVIADIEVICAAPPEMTAAGYGDLVAKLPAGADWMLADALGIEPIERQAWSFVQDQLRGWIDDPNAVRRGDRGALQNLMEGLLMTGFAMQHCKSSRPASGAEHQFSHLWDMEDHHHQGRIPLHGCKVAIGTLASTMLYEQLLEAPLDSLDIERIRANWPSADEIEDRVRCTHRLESLRGVAFEEMRAKYVDHDMLKARLRKLQAIWPSLRDRLHEQLIPSGELRQMLAAAGTPSDPGEIGIDLERLRATYIQAQQIRRRYSVLDLAVETGRMSACLDRLFADDGPWKAGT